MEELNEPRVLGLPDFASEVRMALTEVESDVKHFLNSSWHDDRNDAREREREGELARRMLSNADLDRVRESDCFY